MTTDPWLAPTAARRAELEADARAYRRCPSRRPRPPVSRVRRLYARAWWAVRPRAAAWTPSLFEARPGS